MDGIPRRSGSFSALCHWPARVSAPLTASMVTPAIWRFRRIEAWENGEMMMIDHDVWDMYTYIHTYGDDHHDDDDDDDDVMKG